MGFYRAKTNDFERKGELMRKLGDCQAGQVYRHMEMYDTISSWVAYEKYGITQLATRIIEIKESGKEVFTKWTKNERTGKRYVLYSLKPFDLF